MAIYTLKLTASGSAVLVVKILPNYFPKLGICIIYLVKYALEIYGNCNLSKLISIFVFFSKIRGDIIYFLFEIKHYLHLLIFSYTCVYYNKFSIIGY